MVETLQWRRQGGGQSRQLPPPLGGLDSEKIIVESVVHTAELDVFFNHFLSETLSGKLKLLGAVRWLF